LRNKLPFETQIAICDGRDLLRLEADDPFAAEPQRPDVVRFVSILLKASRVRPPIPAALPPDGEWLVRIIGSTDRFIFGVYRRHMRTITHLGQLDKLYGATATTRNWNTINTVMRVLRSAPA
jgi:uncharacterized protein (DUF1697 family)